MTDNKDNSLDELLAKATAKLSTVKIPEQLENFRNELHHELAMQWPFQNDRLNSKVTPHPNTYDDNKSVLTFGDKEIPHVRSNNLTSASSAGLIGKKSVPTDSQTSLDEYQKNFAWDLRAQEGMIIYPLPDGLPDGIALQNKLQKLMKTNTIHLNDRKFWTKLENRFKSLRKENCQENMKRLRQNQQEYEQELISKGILPHTTEEAIRQYSEQQRAQIKTSKPIKSNSNNKKCLIDYVSSNKKPNGNVLNGNEELEAFECTNVHPRFHEVLTDYQFQTKLGKDLDEKFQNDLYQRQVRIKTIFPKTNQQDRIRQDLDSIKTSEGLYTYSNRLTKLISN